MHGPASLEEAEIGRRDVVADQVVLAIESPIQNTPDASDLLLEALGGFGHLDQTAWSATSGKIRLRDGTCWLILREPECLTFNVACQTQFSSA